MNKTPSPALVSARAFMALSLSLLITGCLIGCLSPAQKAQTCESASALYAAYQASLATGRPVSKDEIVAATSAGAFLRWYCGWTNRSTRAMTASDSNGVPILTAP